MEQSRRAAVHEVGAVGCVAQHRDGSTPDAVVAVETTGVTVRTVESTDATTSSQGCPVFNALREI